jgi:hypothetical protein
VEPGFVLALTLHPCCTNFLPENYSPQIFRIRPTNDSNRFAVNAA